MDNFLEISHSNLISTVSDSKSRNPCFSCPDEEGEVLKTFRECFLRTSSRGPDECRILDTGKGYLGFQRLAIMGLTPSGMQPFSLNGSYVVCNGEIYGFEKQREELKKKGYTFKSDSDCEILLPLY